MLWMKAAVGVMLIGALLAGSAHAAGGPAEPSLSKALPAQLAPSSTSDYKSQSKTTKTSDNIGAIKVAPKVEKLDSVPVTPPESVDESVELKGVRG
jgi:hypothetical protein